MLFISIRINNDILADLRIQDGVALDKWDDYISVRENYLEKRNKGKQELVDLIRTEFINQLDEIEYTDLVPEGFEEDDLRSGMIEHELQDMLDSNSDRLAERVLEDTVRTKFEDKDFVDEEVVIHLVYHRFRSDLLKLRHHETLTKIFVEMEPLVRDLNKMVCGTKVSVKELKEELMDDFDILHTVLKSNKPTYR